MPYLYSNSCHFRLCDIIFPSVVGFSLLLLCSCHAFYIMSSCASHLHSCSSHASEHLPRCPFCNPALLRPPASPFTFSSCVGIKLSRNGPRLDMWPWYSTGRPPVKFRIIWTSFDTPTVNRVTVKASFGLQPKTPPKQPNNPSKSLPCPSPFGHDRVAENRSPFGAS